MSKDQKKKGKQPPPPPAPEPKEKVVEKKSGCMLLLLLLLLLIALLAYLLMHFGLFGFGEGGSSGSGSGKGSGTSASESGENDEPEERMAKINYNITVCSDKYLLEGEQTSLDEIIDKLKDETGDVLVEISDDNGTIDRQRALEEAIKALSADNITISSKESINETEAE